MIIEKYRQFLVVLYVKQTLLGAEIMVAFLVAPSFENDAKINLLQGWLDGAHQKVTTDPSSFSHLGFHKEFILVSFLTAVPDVGVLGHSEFLYHKYSFNIYTYI